MLLKDDHPAALAAVLQYMTADFNMWKHDILHHRTFFSIAYSKWIALTLLTADKYDVDGLRKMLIDGSKEKWHLASDKVVDDGELWQDMFIELHFCPMQEAFGGEYPAMMYGVFARTLAKLVSHRLPTDRMVAAALGDVDLGVYLLGRYGRGSEH